jgi:hypothetical protein
MGKGRLRILKKHQSKPGKKAVEALAIEGYRRGIHTTEAHVARAFSFRPTFGRRDELGRNINTEDGAALPNPACDIDASPTRAASNVNDTLTNEKVGVLEQRLSDWRDHAFKLVDMSEPSLAHGTRPFFGNQGWRSPSLRHFQAFL